MNRDLQLAKDWLDAFADTLDKLEAIRECHAHAGDECMVCAVLACPSGDPLHLHHGGCPACTLNEEQTP